MTPTLPSPRSLISLFSHRARKSLGQHFLINEPTLRTIAAAAAYPTLLEVGPGPGALTAALIPHCQHLLAVDADPASISSLTDHLLPHAPHLSPFHADILRFELPPDFTDWALVGNLPYNISTQIFFRMLDHWRPLPHHAVLMFQREVGARFLGSPETRPDHGALAMISQFYFSIELLLEVPPGAFLPPPSVHSSVIHFTPRTPPLPLPLHAPFRALVKAAFAQRRKTLANNLLNLWSLPKATIQQHLIDLGFPPNARAEALEIEHFCALTESLYPLRGVAAS
jgi:16S rRNA (adenine1518-N6/adenine1519-N6)-dimethyltransferase